MTTKVRLPDFLIVGAMKSGTTTLWRALQNHPDVFLPTLKEPHFFSVPEYLTCLSPHARKKVFSLAPQDKQQYAELFKDASSEQIVGEASASYFFLAYVTIPKILELLGQPKIVIILRNPYERTWSEFGMMSRGSISRNITKDFLSLGYWGEDSKRGNLPYCIEQSLYSYRLRAFLDAFTSVHVLTLDELRSDARVALRSLYQFLGVDPERGDSMVVHHNKGRGFSIAPPPVGGILKAMRPLIRSSLCRSILGSHINRIHRAVRKLFVRQVPIPGEVKASLQPLFKADIELVERLLNKDLSCWK